MTDTEPEILCKSIFKDGKNTTSRETFTKAWINLINQLEKTKDCFYLLRRDKNE